VREGGVDLSGDHTPYYSTAYWTIVRHGLVADGRNVPYGNRAPRTIGSSASQLMKFIDSSHYDAKVSELERKTIRLWIETSATYPGTYASLGCGMYPVNYPIAMMKERCGGCHGNAAGSDKKREYSFKFADTTSLESLTNLDRPEKSLLLSALLARHAGGLGLCEKAVFADSSDPGYQQLLAAINASAEKLRSRKRFDMRDFRPNEHYIREMQRFGILPSELGPNDPIDVYATDQAYWRSFWYLPEASRPQAPRAVGQRPTEPTALIRIGAPLFGLEKTR
jgi:hypothetical protein